MRVGGTHVALSSVLTASVAVLFKEVAHTVGASGAASGAVRGEEAAPAVSAVVLEGVKERPVEAAKTAARAAA